MMSAESYSEHEDKNMKKKENDKKDMSSIISY